MPQSPEEIDKEERSEVDAKKESDEPGDDTDVFTQKHSENLFQRTEVLAGEAVFAKVYLTRNKTENKRGSVSNNANSTFEFSWQIHTILSTFIVASG